MKIFYERDQVNDVPIIRLRDGERWLNILWGINYSKNWAEPIYRTTLRYWRSGGIAYIELPNLLIMLLARRPFIVVEKSKGIHINEE